MMLQELIETLERADQNLIIPNGFKSPHSYRGYYDQLAFEPTKDVPVSEMLSAAKEAVGKTYFGWKGGEFKMYEGTDCWIADRGCCGEALGSRLLNYILAEGHLPN